MLWYSIGRGLQAGLRLLQTYWQLLLLATLLLAGVQYVRRAEQTKIAAHDAALRAAVAESLLTVHAAQSAALTGTIDTLKTAVQRADQRYAAALARLRSAPRSTPTFVPDASLDSTPQTSVLDTASVLERPEVKELLSLCEARVSVRDSVITAQDARHVVDSLTIRQLRLIVPTPLPPPTSPSRFSRVVLGVASGTVGALVGQQVSGQKGLLIGASVGTLLSLLR